MATKSEQVTDAELREQVKALRDDLEKLSGLVVQSASARGQQLVDDASSVGSSVLDEAVKSLETGREFGEQQLDGAERWIKQNPFVAVLCALGAGFVLALLRSRD